MRSSARLIALLTTLPLVIFILLRYQQTAATDIPLLPRQTIDNTFAGAQAAHAADVDGDGDMDVVGAAANDNEITWWENANGDGSTWNTNTITATFAGAIDAVPADIDGDGDMDIVGAALVANDIIWWQNDNGDGSSWSGHAVDLDFGGVYDVHVDDVDGDGDLDIVGAASVANDLTWWENDSGDGSSWTRHDLTTNYAFASSIFTADIDHDGDLDVVSAAGSDDKISWWENRLNTAQSWLEHPVSTAVFDFAHWVHAADVDGDGDTDILGAALNDNTIAWWANDDGSGGSWTYHAIDIAFAGAHTVYAVDLDLDGDIDVLGAGLNNQTIAWWENVVGDGLSWNEHEVDSNFTGAHAVETADFDQDGDPDILGAARDINLIAWWPNDTIHRNAIFPTEETVVSSFSNAFAVHADDINGDGQTDILGGAFSQSTIAWFNNNGGSWTQTNVDTSFSGVRSITTADVDNDGDTDVLGAGTTAGTIAWFDNTASNGTSWTRRNVATTFGGAFWVDAADIDGDGDIDVLGASGSGNSIAWWQNADGSGTNWNPQIITTTFPFAVGVHGTDVDGDGDTDIVGASFGIFPTGVNGRITWWDNLNGDGTSWLARDVDSNYLGAVGIFAADMDGDGDMDLVGAANKAETFTWWQNVTGDGTVWQRDDVGFGFANAEGVYAADMDNDGDMDILGASQDSAIVAWWENVNGDGSAWNEHIVAAGFTQAVSVFAADVDGNGSQDVLAAGAGGNDRLVWWPNLGGQLILTTTDTSPSTILAGLQDDLLQVTVKHNGRTGDNDAELASLELLLESTPGNPLNDAQANALIENLRIYADDGSGTFEPANDILVTTVETLALTDGRQTVSFSDGDANVQIVLGTPRSYFVVTELTATAGSQSPNQLQMTHLTSLSTAQDRDFDLPLTVAYAEDVTAAVTAVTSVTIAQTSTPATALPGQPVTYTLQFNTQVTLTDSTISATLPGPLTNISYISNLPLTPIGPAAWDAGTLAPGTTGWLTLTGQIALMQAMNETVTNEMILNGRLNDNPLSWTTAVSTTLIVPSIQFSPTAVLTVTEAMANTAVTITLSAVNPYAAVTVQVTSSDGTAVGGLDFVAINEVVTVTAGTAVVTVPFYLLDDTIAEGSETFTLTLSSATGADLGQPTTLAIFIRDDEDESAQTVFLPFIATP